MYTCLLQSRFSYMERCVIFALTPVLSSTCMHACLPAESTPCTRALIMQSSTDDGKLILLVKYNSFMQLRYSVSDHLVTMHSS